MMLKTKEEVQAWVDDISARSSQKIREPIINADLTIDIPGTVHLEYLLEEDVLPVKFRKARDFFIGNNGLKTLVGCPDRVENDFGCSWNDIKNFEGAPKFVGGDFSSRGNKQITSLHDFHKYVHEIHGMMTISFELIKDSILGLLLVKGLRRVVNVGKAGGARYEVFDILNKHLPSKGKQSVFDCQEELMNEGYDEYAKL